MPPSPWQIAVLAVLHLARAALAAQLPHRLDEREHAVHAGVRVREPAAVGVHRERRRRARSARPETNGAALAAACRSPSASSAIIGTMVNAS